MLQVRPFLAGSQNIRLNLFDPKKPINLIENFNSTDWRTIDLSSLIPPTPVRAVYLTFFSLNENLTPIHVGIKTSIDDIVVDSIISQVNLIPVHITEGEVTYQVRLLKSEPQPICVACRGFQFTI